MNSNELKELEAHIANIYGIELDLEYVTEAQEYAEYLRNKYTYNTVKGA